MKRSVLLWDVFGKVPFDGNPAAVIEPAAGISAAQLLTLAREFALPETAAFSVRSGKLMLRFANSDRLLARCGHASLGAVASHVASYRHRGRKSRQYTGRYQVGAAIGDWRAIVPVGYGTRASRTMVVSIGWPDRPARAGDLPARKVYPALGLPVPKRVRALPFCIYDSGNRNALVPVDSHAALEAARPDRAKLTSLFEELDLTDLHLYYLSSRKESSRATRLRCRNLFPYGVFEEPATGTASVALAAALMDQVYGARAGERNRDFFFEQGVGQRRGHLRVSWQSGVGAGPAIWLEGRVFLIMEGHLNIVPA